MSVEKVGHDRCKPMLCRDAYSAVEKLRSEVCAVWPDDSVKLRMHAELFEGAHIPQRFEDRPFKLLP
jgi:hypothetical protein